MNNLSMSYISILGNSEIYIENYTNLIEYTKEVIRIQTKTSRIELYGKQLHIEYFSNEDMKIKGILLKIEFQKGGSNC